MTDTLAKPVEAWAVVDKDGWFSRHYIFDVPAKPSEQTILFFDKSYADRAPHRVARVLITEIKESSGASS